MPCTGRLQSAYREADAQPCARAQGLLPAEGRTAGARARYAPEAPLPVMVGRGGVPQHAQPQPQPQQPHPQPHPQQQQQPLPQPQVQVQGQGQGQGAPQLGPAAGAAQQQTPPAAAGPALAAPLPPPLPKVRRGSTAP